MRHRSEPYRQCIGCRDVRPKKELLRLVILPTGEVFFDPAQKKPGRGFYLCPENKCFHMAFRNKKWHHIFRGISRIDEVIRTILESFQKIIQSRIDLSMKMRCLADIHMQTDDIGKGDVIIIQGKLPYDEKKALHAIATDCGAEIFDLPGNCIEKTVRHIKKACFPMISQLTSDLNKYERLSSKGLAL